MVSELKKKLVQELTKAIKDSPIVGVVNLQSLPAQQYQSMRKTLAKKGVQIRMTRKRLLELALTQSQKQNIEELKAKLKGVPALILAKDNPFILYATLQKSKSVAPAKGGQIAPREIVVKAGPTNFAPGPIISELAAVGIKTKVDAGKLAIMTDAIVAKEGDVISPKLAEALKRLDIKPMEIGLDLVAVWENGSVFDAKTLHIDEAEYLSNIAKAFTWAVNLSIEAGYPTADTAELIIQKAFRDSKAVSLESAFLTAETRDELLASSEQQALSVKSEANFE